VFQTQLEALQDGDRLYYLARTPGLNMRTQLEGNSFSEIIQRNTDNTFALKADAFATADCKFQLANLTFPAAAGSFITGIGSVNDDPTTTDCNENRLLLRQPDGTIQYRAINSVDKAGINGQSVYNGTLSTTAGDRIFGGNDNDTFWGGPGNDVIEGNGGDDVALGGDGNDIITDLSGADVLKGGPGNDALDGGIGDDILLGGSGQDFINGGANDNETFAGPGNDFIIAGQGADAVFGDGGDDWIEGGTGQDLLQGDHGAPFFDDPGQTAPGNDIFIGQPGENDYDAEGGDDLMAQNAAIDRNAGAGGFDWAFHQYNTIPADDDMNINQQLLGLPIQLVVNRDRWQETEADSGANFPDVIRATTDERITGPAGFIGCDALDNAGVDRINGLRQLVNTFPTLLSDVVAASATKFCPLVGSAPNSAPGTGVWAEGNILLGGGGSDQIEGRGNNDVIDGDHMLRVRISVRANADGTGAELGTTDLMENAATAGNFGPGTTGMTLQQAVFAGLVNPGQLVATREIVSPTGVLMGASANLAAPGDCGPIDPVTHIVNIAGTTNCDTAIYSAPPDQYTVTANIDGSVTVAFNNAVKFGKDDGIDTLWNMENVRFCTANDPVTKNCTAFQDVPLAARIAVSATALTFANQGVGTASAVQTVIVTNPGTQPLTVSGVTILGTDPTSFTQTSTCTTVAVNGSCTISVRFTPVSTGAKTATLNIAANDPTKPLTTVTLTGTGVPAAITLAPSSLTFTNQAVGTTSAVQNIVVTNTSAGSVTINTVTLGGPNANQFTATTAGCARARNAGQQFCIIGVRFTPTAAAGPGAKTATITIVSNAGTFVANLTGSTSAAAAIGVAATLNVGRLRTVGATSTTPLTVTNTGSIPLIITAVTTTGAAYSAILNTCALPVAPGGTCQITVTFHPTVAGNPITGTLSITAPAASNTPRTVNLTGRAP